MSDTDLARFGKIDQTADAAYFIHFLDAACAEASFAAYKGQLLGRLSPGWRCLDVGCGTGDDARAMARRVGPGGAVVGLDNSALMLDEARRRGTPDNLEFRHAEAGELPFADGSFDAAVADRSLMHVPDARRALAEMARVARTVLVFEVDFGTVTLDVPDRDRARQVVHTWADGFRDGWLGRRMPRLFVEAGLEDVEVVPHVLRLTPALALPIVGRSTAARAVAAGTVSAGEAEAWLATLDDLERTGRFFSTLTGFFVAGRA